MKTYTVDTPINAFRAEVSEKMLQSAMYVLKPSSPLATADAARIFTGACRQFNIDQVYLMAHAILESNWGTSNIATTKQNYFGYMAFDSNVAAAKVFKSLEDCVFFMAAYISKNYLSPSGKWYSIGPTLRGMNVRYATSKTWADSISKLAAMIELKLPTIEPPASITALPLAAKAKVIGDKGVNVRSFPSIKGSLVTTLAKGSMIDIAAYTVGDSVEGNSVWLQTTAGHYVWSGATDTIPTLPKEGSTAEVVHEKTYEEIVAELSTLTTKYNTVVANGQTKDKEITDLKADVEIKAARIAALSNDSSNVGLIKAANEDLSVKLEAQTQARLQAEREKKEAFVQAFSGWTLIEIPVGLTRFSRIATALKTLYVSFVSKQKEPFVIGWKVGATLHPVDGQTEDPGTPSPESLSALEKIEGQA